MKTNGKDICKELKSIRKKVAEQNDIPLEQHECQYDGPCDGTCPRCEAEVKYLEQELHRRMTLGKAAAVAGVALSLAAFTSCASEGEVEPEPQLLGDIVPEQTDTTSTPTDTNQTTIQYQ
ncbi:MAG: hypothetical protein IJ745_08415 [Bacteroidales bacterium]|nr:hypothetical protein [Bacteroidales bacterium]